MSEPSSRSMEEARKLYYDPTPIGSVIRPMMERVALALDAARAEEADKFREILRHTVLSQDEIAGRARAEEREAYGYLRRVFEICAPECEPLPDLMGLCTQIDNLIAEYRIALENARESEERTSAPNDGGAEG